MYTYTNLAGVQYSIDIGHPSESPDDPITKMHQDVLNSNIDDSEARKQLEKIAIEYQNRKSKATACVATVMAVGYFFPPIAITFALIAYGTAFVTSSK